MLKVTCTEASPTKPVRPKAKVTSSLPKRPSTRDGTPTVTPRATSPAASLSPTFQPKVRATASTPPTPRGRPRAPTSQLRARQSSATLHHAASTSDIDGRLSPSPPVRIKSKVSNLATTRPPPQPALYPITTAAPAANPHRYAPRSPPLPQPKLYQPFRAATPVVDPAFIPLPTTHSPTASAVSFSSRSSISVPRPNVSLETDHSDTLRSTLDNLLRYTDNTNDDTELDTDDDNHSQLSENNVKAEAKSNRKIADLEITNRSLLAINASLESAKHKQQKEIRDLRRKLRESRLILPPRAFRAVKDDDDAQDDISSSSEDEQDEHDEVYVRIKAILEGLLQNGRRALEDYAEGKGGTKVLSAEEVKSYHAGSDDDDDQVHVEEQDADPAHIAVPDSDVSITSEDEVEITLTGIRDTPSPLPRRVS